MAQRTILVDDLDGHEGEVNTVQFSLDGKEFEIDLGTTNANKLRKALDPFVTKARVIGGKTVRKSSKRASRDDLQEVREWARKNGFEVAERGRVPKEIKDAYDAAHASRAA